MYNCCSAEMLVQLPQLTLNVDERVAHPKTAQTVGELQARKRAVSESVCDHSLQMQRVYDVIR